MFPEIDGEIFPMVDFNLTEEISTLQWKEAPSQLTYISAKRRNQVLFFYVGADHDKVEGEILGWRYRNASNTHTIFIIND